MTKNDLLHFAKLSMSAYRDYGWEELGYTLHKKIDKHGVQCYILKQNNVCVVVFRGSDEKIDWVNNFQARLIQTTYGYMHKGFKKLWDKISKELRDNIPSGSLVYFTGHSLGGALALISSFYITHKQVVTFGSPMIIEKNYPPYLKPLHIRVVNNNDIVPRLPSKKLGYTHIGKLFYLSYSGELLETINFFDNLRSRLKAWSKGEFFNAKYDHDLNLYIKKLSK